MIEYRTGKRWHGAGAMLSAWRYDGAALVVTLSLDAVDAARKMVSIQTKSEWRIKDRIYSTARTVIKPSEGVLIVIAKERDNDSARPD